MARLRAELSVLDVSADSALEVSVGFAPEDGDMHERRPGPAPIVGRGARRARMSPNNASRPGIYATELDLRRPPRGRGPSLGRGCCRGGVLEV